jgi:enoyl-[acyl-carrier protein] reductase I
MEDVMKLLEGKNALVFGVANKRSIAWGITQAFHEHGANVGISYAGEVLAKRAIPLGESLGLEFIEPCDVTEDDQIIEVAEKAKKHFGEIDILVHAIAFAGRDLLTGNYYDTTREGFISTMEISVFSFPALVKAFQPILREGGSLMTLSYYASEKVFPNYNVMGVAKAALEASTRFLARDLGPQGVRVNTISPGPIRTLAAAGVKGFKTLYKKFGEVAPLEKDISIEDVGNTAVYLASDLSGRTTGQVIFVDSGYNIMGLSEKIGDE